MAANNLTNKLKVFAEATTNKLDDTAFAGDIQRQDGYQPNQIISSKITNTILRQTSVVTTALVEALKELSEKNLTNAMTFGSDTILADAKTAIKEALVNVKVAKAILADNVVGGALVEETNIARKFKAGWQISQEFKEKMVFKGTWEGTYINNDIVYYGTAGAHKGYYVVHGLTKESVNELSGVITPAQTLTITSGNTPGTGAISGNLRRLTYETELGSDTALSKVTSISGSSTDNQFPSAKAVYTAINTIATNLSTHVAKTDNPHAVTKAQVGLTNVTDDKQLKDSDKVTTIASVSTDNNIPSAKAVYDYVETAKSNIENRKWALIRDTTSWTTISTIGDVNGTPTLISCSFNDGFSVGDVLAFELAIDGYTDRPFIVQSVLTLNSVNPDTGNIFKAEGLTTYDRSPPVTIYEEVRHYIKFSYSEGINLRFKSVGWHGPSPTAKPLAINYIKDDYTNAPQEVKSKGSNSALLVRRIWRIR